MEFGDRLYQLRRKQGLSQEKLADLLQVTRQSVSKWESGQAMPELSKLIQLADLFQVTLDELVRGEAGDKTARNVKNSRPRRQNGTYEYRSKAHIGRVPLVHVRFDTGGFGVARGIIAIGNVSVGIVSVGGISLGIISLGGLSAGLLLALGGIALGGLAFGGVAVGVIAAGAVSIAVYGWGSTVLAKELGYGLSVSARVAAGRSVAGEYTLTTEPGMEASQIIGFFLEHSRGFGRMLAEFLAGLLR